MPVSQQPVCQRRTEEWKWIMHGRTQRFTCWSYSQLNLVCHTSLQKRPTSLKTIERPISTVHADVSAETLLQWMYLSPDWQPNLFGSGFIHITRHDPAIIGNHQSPGQSRVASENTWRNTGNRVTWTKPKTRSDGSEMSVCVCVWGGGFGVTLFCTAPYRHKDPTSSNKPLPTPKPPLQLQIYWTPSSHPPDENPVCERHCLNERAFGITNNRNHNATSNLLIRYWGTIWICLGPASSDQCMEVDQNGKIKLSPHF